MRRPVAIVGAGLAGLACALHLHRHGVDVRLFEASDDVGGRLRTDEVQGFLLDRGFQAFNPAYPEASRMLDYDQLGLRSFENSFTLPTPAGLLTLPQPTSLWSLAKLLRSPLGTTSDRLRAARLYLQLSKGPAHRFLHRPEVSTIERLQQHGFSAECIDQVFRPLLSAAFLDPVLDTSSRWFELQSHLRLRGQAALPREGIQAIPRQLAKQLPDSMLHIGTTVQEVSNRSVVLASGEVVYCGATVLATSQQHAERLLDEPPETPSADGRSVRCLYFGAPADAVPFKRPSLVLGRPGGVVTCFCVPSVVAPSYAPPDRHLVAVTVLPFDGLDPVKLETLCRAELTRTLGKGVRQWRLLDHQVVDDALAPQRCGEFHTQPSELLTPGIFRCGDYLETSSIQGALVSGRKTADRVRRALQDDAVRG